MATAKMIKTTGKQSTGKSSAAKHTAAKTPTVKEATNRLSKPPKDVDEFLAAQPDDVRAALEKLRKDIRAAAPKAIEVISYGVPTFRTDKPIVSYWAARTHCALNLRTTELTRVYADDLKNYDASGGTIRFPASKPLPSALVKKLVKARIALNEIGKKG